MIHWRTVDEVINFVLFLFYTKQVDSILACICLVIRSKKTSNCGKNYISDNTVVSIRSCILLIILPTSGSVACINENKGYPAQ